MAGADHTAAGANEQLAAALDHVNAQVVEEGAKTARIMGISLHPFITGVAYRNKYLRRALLEIAAAKDIWLATGSEIVSWFKEALPWKEE